MAGVRCVDGRWLDVVPVAVPDREGTTYEVTLALRLDGAPFGDVGERCGWALTGLAAQLREAGPDAVPPSLVEAGVRAGARARGEDPDALWDALRPHLPRDHELLCLRSRDPDDPRGDGQLRVVVQQSRRWAGGSWLLDVAVLLEAWGADGAGVRAGLTPGGLLGLLDGLLAECASLGYGPADGRGAPVDGSSRLGSTLEEREQEVGRGTA